jgi:hypothetical protein
MAAGAPWARTSLPGLWSAHASRRCPMRARRVVTPHGHDQSTHGAAGVDGLSTVENQNKARGNGPQASAIMPLYDDLGGEGSNGVLTRGADGMVEEDGVNGETSLQWKMVLQNRPPSCARGPSTLGTTWPATRSTEGGAHRRSAEVSDRIQCRGQKSGARATKPSAKAP